ncbi:MAG: dephospho-CoA kinase [Myxococcales bacterium]|nr:MAG: dephospho-CoA kinase [Myxococcales bacterium]
MSTVFGLTGGIASGKTAVARRFQERGVPVVDADQVARDVVLPGTAGLAAVVAAFGPAVLRPEGDLDRKALGALVFADPARRASLNSILHPRIAAATAAHLARLDAAGEPLVCYDAALLVENGLADAFRPLVVVAAAPSLQHARLMSRDGLSEDEARSRIAAQMPLADKLRVADVVITNDTTLAELLAATDRALDDVFARAGVDPARYPAP